ncbi:aminotransferase class I/II-fold pyridoxal phosphate-dependent enzyme [Rhodobacteraceae bacterium NNCM2]|nr:aminotransferase class I/II-fold pyridoxal phosphate-dependent enzyme [Coraliihabitans acroporae]
MDLPDWLPESAATRMGEIAARNAAMDDDAVAAEIDRLIERNAEIHDRDCINLNPATNVMNPAAEAVQARGLGPRPSLGYPGDKYEMGLEAIEEIEVIAASLAAEVFDAKFAEVRVASGALANLYAFMACCQPGDAVIVPPPAIGGHVTHQEPGAAGLYGLDIHYAPVKADRYTVDLDALEALAARVKPRLITIGGSLNIEAHPVAGIREIADKHGAKVLFDAAHLCGMIAGRTWPNPLGQGAHLMTMSTYKSLGGPAGGLIVTDDADLYQRLDKIAFPGLTANFDAGRVAALAVSLLDWRAHGAAYAEEMVASARTLAAALYAEDVPVFLAGDEIATRSHQFAIQAAPYGGGQAAAKHLRRANLLTCGIGLPIAGVEGDMNGLRLGTPEVVRRGMTSDHMGELARLITRALGPEPEVVAADVTDFRARFQGLQFIR